MMLKVTRVIPIRGGQSRLMIKDNDDNMFPDYASEIHTIDDSGKWIKLTDCKMFMKEPDFYDDRTLVHPVIYTHAISHLSG
jgi:hypothetical protein